MNPRRQADLGLAFLSGIAHQDPTMENRDARIARKLARNAHRAFLPSPLQFALAGLAGGAGRKLVGMQIGANDGADEYRSAFFSYFDRVVLVEPQPALIPRLSANYADFAGAAIVENVAIGTGDRLPLFVLDDEGEAVYMRHVGRTSSYIVGSDRSRMVAMINTRCKVALEEAEVMVKEVNVPATTIEKLALKNGISHLDFLQVDCEGYDWIALKTLGSLRPSVINFESKFLPKLHREGWSAFAAEEGYAWVTDGLDTVAIRGASLT